MRGMEYVCSLCRVRASTSSQQKKLKLLHNFACKEVVSVLNTLLSKRQTGIVCSTFVEMSDPKAKLCDSCQRLAMSVRKTEQSLRSAVYYETRLILDSD